MIELEEAGREFNGSTAETINEVDTLSSSPNVDVSPKHEIENEQPSIVRQPTVAELRTESLVDSARGEILSIRSSLSRSSTFDTGVVQGQVARYSKRLSLLLLNDQNSIDQRWSVVLSPSYETDQHSPDGDTSEGSKPTSPGAQGVPSSVPKLSDTSLLANSTVDKPPKIIGSENSSTNYKGKSHSLRTNVITDAFSDPLYLETLGMLMLRTPKDRQIILNALIEGVYGTAASGSISLKQSVYRAEEHSTIRKRDVQIRNWSDEDYKTRLEKRKEQMSEIRGTPRWHEACIIQKVVGRQLQGRIDKPNENHQSETDLITINLDHRNLSFIPDHMFELLYGLLKDLRLSRNRLTQLPDNIALCSQLRHLNLSGNQFSSIPNPVLQLSQLEVLNISHNHVRVIPGKIHNMLSLKVLSVEYNLIKGIPFALGSMPELMMFSFSHNPVIFPSQEDLGEHKHAMDNVNDLSKCRASTAWLKGFLTSYPAQIPVKYGELDDLEILLY